MRVRFAKAALAVLLLALGAAPSSAGPAFVRTFISTGGVAATPLIDGSVGYAALWQVDFGEFRLANFLFPEPTPILNYPPTTSFVGCIGVGTSTKILDGGCTVLTPAQVVMDPAMNETSLVFTVENDGGYRLTAALVLSAAGTPGPMDEVMDSTISDDPGTGFPRITYVKGIAGLARVATITGAIRSDFTGLGGSTVAGLASTALMMRGIFEPTINVAKRAVTIKPGLDFYFDSNKPLCIGQPPAQQCPIP